MVISVACEDGDQPVTSTREDTSEDEAKPSTPVEANPMENCITFYSNFYERVISLEPEYTSANVEADTTKEATPVEVETSENVNRQSIQFYCDVCKKAISLATGDDFATMSALEEHKKLHHKSSRLRKPDCDAGNVQAQDSLGNRIDLSAVSNSYRTAIDCDAGNVQAKDSNCNRTDLSTVSSGNQTDISTISNGNRTDISTVSNGNRTAIFGPSGSLRRSARIQARQFNPRLPSAPCSEGIFHHYLFHFYYFSIL